MDPRRLLLDTQNPDGGWPTAREGPSTTEATAWASLAAGETQAAATAGRRWLVDRQRPDGSWGVMDGVSQSSWMTAPAVLAMGCFPAERERTLAGARWLLGQEGRGYPWWTRLLLRLSPDRAPVRLDPDLKGWPWAPGTFSWVEPTSLALIALRGLQDELPDPRAGDRIRMAERMLFDRMCVGGGWNYGNSVVLGDALEPYPDTTAWALIALQRAGRRSDVRRSLGALRVLLEGNDSVLSLSLAMLALRLHGEDAVALGERLSRRLGVAAEGRETRAVALAALALDPRPPSCLIQAA